MINRSLSKTLPGRDFMDSRSGAVAIEYGLIAALITILLIASMASMGESTAGMFDSVKVGWEDALQKAPGAGAEAEAETE